MNLLKQAAILISLCAISGCAAFQAVDYPLHKSEDVADFRKGFYKEAAASLAVPAQKLGPDRLVYLLDRAMALHAAGDYRASNALLLEADKLSEPRDFAQPAKLRSINTANMERVFYSGDEFENILVSVYMSLNYALLGQDEDAINSIRRAETKLARLQSEGGRPYNMPAFFHYWSALLYERNKNFSSALVDYEKANRDGDRLRAAIRNGQEATVTELRSKLSLANRSLAEQYREVRDAGSLILIWQNAFIVPKAEHPEYSELAFYQDPYAPRFRKAVIFIDGEEVARTELGLDISQLARENYTAKLNLFLQDRAEGFPHVEKVRERKVAKNPVHKNYRIYDKAAKLTADLRQWSTLPSEIQLSRVVLRPGTHRIMLRLEDEFGQRGPFRDLGEVEISSAKETKIITYRSLGAG